MDKLVTHYRQLHRFPELSGNENRTPQYIEDALSKMRYNPRRIGRAGVIADLVMDPKLPWLLFRADMDALAIQENSCAAVQSEVPGMMHACGHDAHCAMLLETARLLQDKHLPHNIRFLFQPAEETTKGAAEMIECGALPRNLCACFAMHVWPGIEKGMVATRPGALMASSDVFQINVFGKRAHCAQSHLGADALKSAVELVSSFSRIKATAEDPNTILFCGSIHSGNSHNIVADAASISGTIRSFSASDRKNIKDFLINSVSCASQAAGIHAELRWDGGCPAIRNDRIMVDLLKQLQPSLMEDTAPTMAAEDFACYQEYAPGVMLWLGLGDVPPLHNEAFYVPEDVLPFGVELWGKIAAFDWSRALKNTHHAQN